MKKYFTDYFIEPAKNPWQWVFTIVIGSVLMWLGVFK
jgi:hypothetical protein